MNDRKYTFNLHEDAGHGWLAVPISCLSELKLMDYISNYSYINKGIAYLEEDCDASFFLRHCKSLGIDCEIREIDDGDYSFIRHFARMNRGSKFNPFSQGVSA